MKLDIQLCKENPHCTNHQLYLNRSASVPHGRYSLVQCPRRFGATPGFFASLESPSNGGDCTHERRARTTKPYGQNLAISFKFSNRGVSLLGSA
jgi:hypothetical protein